MVSRKRMGYVLPNKLFMTSSEDFPKIDNMQQLSFIKGCLYGLLLAIPLWALLIGLLMWIF